MRAPVRAAQHLGGGQQVLRPRARRVLARRGGGERRLLEDQQAVDVLEVVVRAEPERVDLALGGRVHPAALVARERALLVVGRDDVLPQLGPDLLEQVAEAPDDGEVPADGVTALQHVTGRHGRDADRSDACQGSHAHRTTRRHTPPMRYALRTLADVPPDDDWLSPRERAVLDGLEGDRRRAEWRLGRWAAKALLGPGAEVLVAPDGAPATDGVSISHRKGRALAVVAEGAVGCDLEPLERRSDAFLRTVLSEAERERVEGLDDEARMLAGTIAWTAKEAAFKALRGGREIRDAEATFDAGAVGAWHPVRVDWPDGASTSGWWRVADGWVMSVASEPPAPAPRP